jgi:glutamine amidotransferase
MIVIVDYGMGNLGSIMNMLKKLGAEAKISAHSEDVVAADRLILPGVGAFDAGMRQLHASGLIDVLNHQVLERRRPLLGICLGMQLLTRRSEEGKLPGLGWVKGETVRFAFHGANRSLKVPHMGWNSPTDHQASPLFHGLENEAWFYFVHSYHVVCERAEDVAARTHYGYPFVSALCGGNIMGTQFHPEKSHRYGMQVLRNFVGLN